ncbi:MAG TPA: SAM-dependent methyltransferase [Candidatus Polarisedimenticolia bacterium]|nr:SAM-dependent methyltransferase [Candidatus Polarisedimenticolia bacterium]
MSSSPPLPLAGEEVDLRLLEVLHDRILHQGPISFAEFMELALYHPELGYYARPEDPVGAEPGRDFYTAPTCHPAFGALVGRQVAECLQRVGGSRRQWVEFGPGSGAMAAAILAELRSLGLGEAAGIEAVLVEANPHRRAWQRRLLESSGPLDGVIWMTPSEWERESPRMRGCLLANELLDALPVHRYRCEAGEIRELKVGWDDGPVEVSSSTNLPPGPFEGPPSPSEGQEWEVGTAIRRWLEISASRLERGYLLLLDYGHLSPEIYSPRRRRGTLMAYHRHRVSEDYLARVGRQDLTAHVNFSSVLEAAARCGLSARGPIPQGRFLMALGAMEFLSGGQSWNGLEEFRSRKTLQELILPGGMGESHQVLVLATPACDLDLQGLRPPGRWPLPCGTAT